METPRERLSRLETSELEERDREGYEMRPQDDDAVDAWLSEADWPTK
jgi:hypothetical protein